MGSSGKWGKFQRDFGSFMTYVQNIVERLEDEQLPDFCRNAMMIHFLLMAHIRQGRGIQSYWGLCDKKCQEWIKKKFLTNIPGESRWVLGDIQRIKLTLHICVTLIHLSGGGLSTSSSNYIAKDLKMDNFKMKGFFMNMGCNVGGSKIVLNVPFKLPKVNMFVVEEKKDSGPRRRRRQET